MHVYVHAHMDIIMDFMNVLNSIIVSMRSLPDMSIVIIIAIEQL